MELRTATAVIACTIVVGCLPSDRLNSSCKWTGDSSRALNVTDKGERRHLELDAALAEDLAIRYGDSFRSTQGLQVSRQKNRECTASLISTVARLHSVTIDQVELARSVRNKWIDIALVFVPVTILFVIASRFVVRKVDRSIDNEDRWLKRLSLVALTPIVGTFGLMAGEQWEWLVEWARLRNAHLSDRAFRLPIAHDPLSAWISATILFVLVAAHYFLSATPPRASRVK